MACGIDTWRNIIKSITQFTKDLQPKQTENEAPNYWEKVSKCYGKQH